jgi:hypothetical protein
MSNKSTKKKEEEEEEEEHLNLRGICKPSLTMPT